MTPPRSMSATQHHRHPGGGGEAHVGDVVGSQVDLGGAARAFHQDEVRIRLQPLEALQDRWHQFLLHVLEVAGVEVTANLAVDHDLRADVRLRLEQNRVHVHRRRHTAGLWPEAPARGRSRRRPESPPRCWTCSGA